MDIPIISISLWSKLKIMKKVLLVLFMLIYINGWTKDPINKTKIEYTWKGKKVTYKQFRDSLKVCFYRYCDSVKKSK